MQKKYLKYNIEQFVDDKNFIAWILKGDKNNEWENFVNINPQINSKIKKAREIIMLLRDDYTDLDDSSVLEIWQNIDRFQQQQQQHKNNSRSLTIRKSLSWAASILIIFSLGTLAYYFLNNSGTNYQFTSSQNVSQINSARFILPNGEEIELNSDNSTVSLNNENELVINNDSVIDLSQKKTGTEKNTRLNEVVIPYGKKSELLLADGTKVWLNAGSRLAFPTTFLGKNREVFLEGEAYFEVAKNKLQPFIVSVGQLDIKVLGTHFDVSAYPAENSIKTVLLEGSVAISKTTAFGFINNEIILKPNQKAEFEKDINEIFISNEENAEFYISWTEGWLHFSKESLQSVLRKLERYYNVEIMIVKDSSSSELISGKLDLKDSVEDVVRALEDVTKLKYQIKKPL